MKHTVSLLTAFMLMVINVWAADGVRRRPCRPATDITRTAMHRASSLTDRTNLYVGDRRQLVVLAAFQDLGFRESRQEALAKWNDIFNAKGYREGIYVGSVHDYFRDQSYGKFNLTFDLLYITLPEVRHKYRSTAEDDEYSQYMVDHIVDTLMTLGIDWSLYDWDGDDEVDQLLIIYAGRGMNVDGDDDSIWPHMMWLSEHLNLETEAKWDTRSWRTVTGGGREYRIDAYCCVQEWADSRSVKSSFGTICHEYSHCFGLPDFYYYSGTAVVGDWDLMDGGNYNGQGYVPCGYSAHERMFMGWLTPEELTAATTVTAMPALGDAPAACLIRNDAVENEFYIVENRQRKGWDAQLPGSGILVFHIDYDEKTWLQGTPNSYYNKRYELFPASNLSAVYYMESWAYPYIVTNALGISSVVNDSLTDTSKPAAVLKNANAAGTKLMGKPLTRMAVGADGLASFVFMNPDDSGIAPIRSREDDATPVFYDLQGHRIPGQPTRPGICIRNGKLRFCY